MLSLHVTLFREIFLEAEKHIIELMKKNSYPRFISSEYYRNLLQNAPNPVPKKRYVDLDRVVRSALLTRVSVSSGIFHFVKDNYFRTSSSSEDEYDSDDSGRKGGHAMATAHVAGKVQPLGAPLATTTAVAAAVVAANTASIHSSGSDGNK